MCKNCQVRHTDKPEIRDEVDRIMDKINEILIDSGVCPIKNPTAKYEQFTSFGQIGDAVEHLLYIRDNFK